MTRADRLDAAIAGHTARHVAATTYCQPGRSHSDAAMSSNPCTPEPKSAQNATYADLDSRQRAICHTTPAHFTSSLRKAHVIVTGKSLTPRQARRMSRDFARVGVDMSAERLRDISAGAAAGDDEWADIEFALVASGSRDQEHQERLDRLDQRTRRLFRLSATLWALVLVLLAVCLAIAAQHEMLPTLLTR